ncbi:MAG: BatD family protein [Elusimicrobiaceae bacterium]|nr:BatD family protein [Elusimicrobiaceae bacterium]
MCKKIFLVASMVFWSIWAQAQVQLTAQVDKTALTLDDDLTLTVKLSGVSGNIVMPQLPSLPAFNVYSRRTDQSVVNGNVTLIFRYTMVPRFVGKATIGEIKFSYDGKTYTTAPISIDIYRNATPAGATAQPATAQINVSQATPTAANGTHASAEPQAPTADSFAHLPPLEAALAHRAVQRAGEPFFLIAAVSDKAPYVNQPFSLGVRFYFSQNFYEAPYQKPTVSNLFMEEERSVEGTQKIGNTLYHYQEQRYQLTAAAPGKASVGPATVRYRIGSVPQDLFDRFFGGVSVGPEKTAQSAPITLYARPLPQQDRPDSFYGAIGSGYTLKAQTDLQKVPAQEAINLTVTVTGRNDLKGTQNLEFPPMEGFKIYPAASSAGTSTGKNGTLTYYKVFKAVLVPAASGIYTIPPIPWSYFDPKTTSYKTLQTAPINISVTPAEKSESSFSFSGETTAGNGFQTLASDINYLKMTLAPEENLLERFSHLTILNMGCAALLVLGLLLTAVRRKATPGKKAFAVAKNELRKPASCQTISDALGTYLQQKFGLTTGSLPLKEILFGLNQKGVTPATAESFALLWQRLEAERFAPGSDASQSTARLAQQAQDVLKLMEKEARR